MASSKGSWQEAEWRQFIQNKIEEILAPSYHDQAPKPLANVVEPTDPRLPLAIDHTLLKPDATPAQVDKLCDEALEHGFKSCCVNPIYASRAFERFEASSKAEKPLVCCVVGFPLGASTAEVKAFEARTAISNGAKEIDTVIPVGLLLDPSSKYSAVYAHIKTIVDACGPIPVKVIIETSLLPSKELKIAASILATEAGAAFVKTSTGFSGGGATSEDVNLMYNAVRYKGSVKVKASGGVRTFSACREMFAAGAERIGTSSGVSLIQNVESTTSY